MINKGKVINVNKKQRFNFAFKNRHLILICFVYLIGVLTSVLLFKKSIMLLNWQEVINRFYLSREKLNLFKSFALSFLLYSSILALIFISGTSVIGIGTIPVIIFLSGAFMGSVTTYLYLTYKLKGIAFNALIIMPPWLIFITVLLFASKSAIEYSGYLSKIALKRSVVGNKAILFKNYCKVFLLLLFIDLVLTTIDILLSKLFLNLFNF